MTNSFGLLDQIIRSIAIIKKDIKIYYSKGPVILMGVMYPAFMFISFAFGRDMKAVMLMPGLISMSVFFTCSAIAPITFPWETQARTLERLVSSPIAVWTILFGDMMASAIIGVIISIVPIIIAVAVGTTFVNPLILAVAIILGSICFATASLIISSPPASAPQYSQMISSFIKFPLIFISGVFMPLSEMPTFVRNIAFISPLTYFTDLTRYATGDKNYFAVSIDLLVLVLFTVAAWIIAVKLHNRTLPKRV
ncbi:MAG: ABC transporter permease [Dehalococcoidales bacterium]|nr:ABC transporter permease [Dehalococcoidales bacterium]